MGKIAQKVLRNQKCEFFLLRTPSPLGFHFSRGPRTKHIGRERFPLFFANALPAYPPFFHGFEGVTVRKQNGKEGECFPFLLRTPSRLPFHFSRGREGEGRPADIMEGNGEGFPFLPRTPSPFALRFRCAREVEGGPQTNWGARKRFPLSSVNSFPISLPIFVRLRGNGRPANKLVRNEGVFPFCEQLPR